MEEKQNITLEVLAKRLGISTATISRALNRHTQHKVKRQTREKIQRLARKQHYFPNISARNLVRGESHVIGIVIPYAPMIFCSEYYMQLLSGVSDGMMETRYSFTLHLATLTEKGKLIQFLRLKEIAGIIAAEWHFYCRSIKELESLRVPVLGINDPIPSTKVCFVSCDNFQGARDGVQHLIEMGHRKIGMLLGPKNSLDNQERFKGYRTVLKENGIPLDPRWVIEAGRFERPAGYQAMSQLISEKIPVTAVFCANDEIAIGALKAITEKRLRCPQDISILGFDGLKMGEYVHPPLTSVDQKVYELAKQAVGALVDILEGRRRASFIEKVPCRLVERESVSHVREIALGVKS